MNRLLSVFLHFFLLLSGLSFASNDPLNPAYMPAMDTNPAHYAGNVWITDTMQKIRQDGGHPGAQHWGTFYGTQNEFVDFQVHVQAGEQGIPNLSVTAGNFVNARTGTVVSAASRNVVVYREAYMPVTVKTSTADTFYNAIGFYPDILIPAVDPYYHQTTNAWPVNVTPYRNQSAWIDVLIPPSAPSGYYRGSVTVKSGSSVLATMPVVIGVWQWPSGESSSMPSTATLQSYSSMGWNHMCVAAYGSYEKCGAYPNAGGSADRGVTLSVVDMVQLMLDHRFSAASPIYPPYTKDFGDLESTYGPVLSGTANTILPGAKLTSVVYPDSNPAAYAQNWATEFQRKGWPGTLFDYSCDEPPAGCAWSYITNNAPPLHTANPAVPALVTTDIVEAGRHDLLDSIDILCPVINYLDPQDGSPQRPAYDKWLAGDCCNGSGPKRRLWTYQSCMSAGTCSNGTVGGKSATWPNYDVDGKPAANRAMEWMSYRNGVTGELYYMLTDTWERDPWKSVYDFGGNGDGTLLYPGTSDTAGVSKPIYLPSVRLKHIRDGMQDYEYLNVLTRHGLGSVASAQVKSWITNSSTFETTGAGLQAARMALGSAMHQLSYSPVISWVQGIASGRERD